MLDYEDCQLIVCSVSQIVVSLHIKDVGLSRL